MCSVEIVIMLKEIFEDNSMKKKLKKIHIKKLKHESIKINTEMLFFLTNYVKQFLKLLDTLSLIIH